MSKSSPVSSIDWQSELNSTSFRYHVIIAWVAIIFNPLFLISDYFNSPAHLADFGVFRLVITLLILITVLLKEKWSYRPHIIAFVPFIGIAVQNAYMYSVMDVVEFQKHTFAYIALFIGGGMFVIWHIKYSIIGVSLTFIINIILFYFNSDLPLEEILINGGLLTASVAIFTIVLIQTRTNLTKKEIVSRLALAESKKQLEEKNNIIEEKSKDIQDSINYSKGIQEAILPPLEKIDSLLDDYFILYKPKDIVSGDFYWCTSVDTTPKQGVSEHVVLMAAIDCTGHGVPGAMMSVIGNAILNQSITALDVNTPADALDFLNKELAKNLNSIKDGMDLSLVAINMKTLQLQYAGANNPVYIIRNKEIIELLPDKMPIGGNREDYQSKKFTNHSQKLEKGDAIYLFTDGYADQFGGTKGKKFKYKQFQELLISIQDKTMKEQKDIIYKLHEDWRGNLVQVDDVLVIGIRV